jgi:Putative zinc-finger
LTESIHSNVAAFVANALDPAEDAAFAEHLAGCESCREELVWMSEIGTVLAGLDPADFGETGDRPDGTGTSTRGAGPTDTGAAAGTQPAEDDPPPPIDLAAARRRLRRWTGLLVAAVAGLLALGGGAFLLGHSTAHPVTAQQDPAQLLFGTGSVYRADDPATQVTAQVAVVPSRGGADIGLRLSDPVGPKSCELVVISKAGDRQTAMTWSVPAGGYGAGASAPLLTRGQAGFEPDQIAQFEIHSGGRTLLVIPT